MDTFFPAVKLAVGMILWGNEQHWYPFVKTIRQISEQDPKLDGVQSLVIVLLLAEKRKHKIKEIVKKLKSETSDLVSNGYAQLVISKFDSDPNNFEKIKEISFNHVSDVTSLMNYRLAFLLKYCSEISEHAMLIDSEASITELAMKKIFEEINKMRWNTLQINLDSANAMHKLYQKRYLPRVYGTFYALAQLSIPSAIMSSIADGSVHTEKKKYNGVALIKSQTPPVYRNPPAKITCKLQAATGQDNVYLHKGPSWFLSPKKGDHFTVTFNEPKKLMSIFVDTGLDSFKRDLLSHAALELSYSKDIDTEKCVVFNVVASFRDSSFVHITKDDEKTAEHLKKPVHCIRISVTEDYRHWVALKTFMIQ